MKKVVILIFVVVLSATSGSQVVAHKVLEWQDFTSASLGFSIQLPTPPEKADLGVDVRPYNVVTSSTDSTVFQVFAACLPAKLHPNRDFLKVYRDGMVKGVNGVLIDDTEFEYQGYPARAYTVRGNHDNIENVAHVRSILVGQYHYVT
jgi:hypothetical protein